MGGQDINESTDTLAILKAKPNLPIAATAITGTITASQVVAASSASAGLMPLTGTPSGLFLRDDCTWQAAGGAGTPSGTAVAGTAYGLSATAGTSTEYSRGDHLHGTPIDLVSGTAHASLSTGVHGAGTATIATNTDIATHAALTTGAHSLGTMALAASADYYLVTASTTHAAATTVHGLNTMAAAASADYYLVTASTIHAAAATGVHGAGTANIATTTDIATHAGLTASHGVAGTIASVANIATHAALTTGVHGSGTSLIAYASDITTHAALTTGVHGAGTSLIAYRADITDSNLITAANTAANVTTAKHGFCPIAPSNTTTFLRGDATWAAPAGGADPWVYLTLAATVSTTATAGTNVTGLAFAPAANTKYDVFGMFYLKTASSLCVPIIGNTWPTNMTNGVASYYVAVSASTQVVGSGNIAAAIVTPAGALANSTQSWPGQMNMVCTAGSAVSGSIQITLKSEIAGTSVSMLADSFIKYRSYT